MAKMQIEGLEEYTKVIQRISDNSDVVIAKSVYEGARIVADDMKSEMKKITVDNGVGSEKNKLNGISNLQKADLINGFGIAPIKVDGDYTNTKLGFSGYGRTKTKKYPKGVPIQIIARSVNSGTSFRKKNPFVQRTVNRIRKKAQQAMAQVIDEEIKKEMK